MRTGRAFGLAALGAALAAPVAVLSAQDAPRTSEHIYALRCAYCHDAGGWGTRALARRMPESEAMLLDRTDLPPAYTTFVVRRGLRSMPPFNPSELTDQELEQLAQWLEDRN